MKYKDIKRAADADRAKQKLVGKLLTKKSTVADKMQLLSLSVEELEGRLDGGKK